MSSMDYYKDSKYKMIGLIKSYVVIRCTGLQDSNSSQVLMGELKPQQASLSVTSAGSNQAVGLGPGRCREEQTTSRETSPNVTARWGPDMVRGKLTAPGGRGGDALLLSV